MQLEEVAWFWSRASARGSCSRAALPGHISPCGELVPADEVMRGWISGVQFKEMVSYKFGKQEQTNLLEMQAHETWAIRIRRAQRAGGLAMLGSLTRESSQERSGEDGVRRGS